MVSTATRNDAFGIAIDRLPAPAMTTVPRMLRRVIFGNSSRRLRFFYETVIMVGDADAPSRWLGIGVP